jgi:cytochrome P450
MAAADSSGSGSPIVFDPTSREYQADPYPILGLIREAEPVYRSNMGWLVTRYEHAVAILRDWRTWGVAFTRETQKSRYGPGPMLEYANRRMSGYNPPDHTRLRSLTTKAFTARRVEALRPRIQSIAQDLLRQVDGVREFDIIEVLAHPLPCQVICEMVGVPLASSPQLSDWTGAVQSALAPIPRPDRLPAANQAASEFMAFIRALVADRRKRPGDDLLSALIAAEDSGQKLTEDELVATVLFLFTAGHSTTRDLVGSGLVALLHNRDQWLRLIEQESLVPMAVEECLRYAPSILLLGRRAIADTAVADIPISAGEAVFVSIAAANRDPRRFVEPDRFDIARDDNEHLTFGGGIHFCLGATLARVEAQVIFAALARRYPNLRLSEQTVEWRDTISFRGPKAVRVAV